MSVAALGPNPPYDRPASFTSGGPNDYADPVNGTKIDARQVVDIAAPGENLSAAYYGGETGGNGTTDNPAVSGPGPTGLPSGPLGGPDPTAVAALLAPASPPPPWPAARHCSTTLRTLCFQAMMMRAMPG